MAAATLTTNAPGRQSSPINVATFIPVTVTLTATVYAAASGGAPIDLTTVLQQAAPSGWDAPNYVQAINPADVVGIFAPNLSTNGFLPMSLVIGTPTYTAVPGQSANGVSATPGILATCPATFRLFGTGAGNALALAQVADGAVTDAVTFWLVVMRNGANN
jgi:hypothetical protein